MKTDNDNLWYVGFEFFNKINGREFTELKNIEREIELARRKKTQFLKKLCEKYNIKFKEI